MGLWLQWAVASTADLGERQAVEPAREASEAPAPPKVRLLGCPGHDEGDRLALLMLGQLLDPVAWEMELLSLEISPPKRSPWPGKRRRRICIGALPPGGLAHTRYLCKRLRARLPDAKIVVGRLGG